MSIDNNIEEAKQKEKRVLAWQYGVFFAMFILFVPITLFVLNTFNGSIRYALLPLSIPIFYIGISSIKNRVSILRLKGRKEPARGKQAVIFGFLLTGSGIIQLLFVFIPPLLNMLFNFMSSGFAFPFQKSYDALPIYNEANQTLDIYRFDENSAFTRRHTFTDVSIWGDYKAIPLAMNSDTIFFAGQVGQTTTGINLKLFSADISTGKINWQATAGSGFIALDSKNIYAQAPNSFAGPAVSIVAYDIGSGSEVWRTTFDWNYAIGIEYMVLAPQSLEVTTINHNNSEIYLIEPENGNIQTSFKDKDEYTLFMVENETFYDWTGKYVTATGKINWKTQVSDENYVRPAIDTIAPVIANGLILVKSGDGAYSPITALRKNDGSIVWKFEQIVVSNIAVDGSVAYFLTENAQLVAINSQTGEVLGVADFTPKFYKDFDFVNTSIYVVAYNKTVAIYFENTNQITIMRFNQ